MTENWLVDWMMQGPRRKKSKGLMRRLLRAEQLETRYVLTGSGCGVGGDPGTSVVTIEKLNVVREDDSGVAALRVHRSSSGPTAFTVNLGYSGTATNGVNFSGPTTAAFTIGNSYVDVPLNGISSASPLGSIIVEGNRSRPGVNCSSRRGENWRNRRHDVAADHARAVVRLAA